MRHIIIVSGLLILLFISTLLLDWHRELPAVQAQADPNAPTLSLHAYLPMITGKSAIKSTSGIHLGNRGSDWPNAMFSLITTRTLAGIWPAAVVIQSDQVYNLLRPTGSGPSSQATELCRITSATVKQTNGVDYAVYDYLTHAIQQGTIVIIRITPSPGNFLDYAHPGLTPHTLLANQTPAGGDYCGDKETQKRKVQQYRDIHDIADEMDAIYQVNTAHNWPLDRFYFEPANEPNYEWYQKFKNDGKDIVPNVDNKQAWIEMDEYFATLYDGAKQLNGDLQILSPPMAQKLYGEHFGLGTCKTWTVGDGGQHSGFDFMKKTYGYDYAVTGHQAPAKADGFSLHNYWQAGQEAWDTNGGVSLDTYCDYANGGNQDLTSVSDHLSQYFPDAMAVTMRQSGKPLMITEADLVAPCTESAQTLIRKDRLPGDPIDYPRLTSNSITAFVQQEFGARYVISWLLVNEYEGSTDCDTNNEINWHEAYRENGQARDWFTLWWPITP
jgi:hypothetical protein